MFSLKGSHIDVLSPVTTRLLTFSLLLCKQLTVPLSSLKQLIARTWRRLKKVQVLKVEFIIFSHSYSCTCSEQSKG